MIFLQIYIKGIKQEKPDESWLSIYVLPASINDTKLIFFLSKKKYFVKWKCTPYSNFLKNIYNRIFCLISKITIRSNE